MAFSYDFSINDWIALDIANLTTDLLSDLLTISEPIFTTPFNYGTNMMEENKPKATFPPLHSPEDLTTLYVNLVRISHSPSELVFEFAHLLPGTTPARVLSRMVMSPLGAKLFFNALGENLRRYEGAFGEINVPGQKSLADNLFRPPTQGDQPPEG